MTYYTEKLMKENKKFKKFIEDFQLGVNLFPNKKYLKHLTASVKQDIQTPLNKNVELNMSFWDPKKSKTPIVKNSFNLKKDILKKMKSDEKQKKSDIDYDNGLGYQVNKQLSDSKKK